MRLYRDPLLRRFLSGSVFAGLFVWVAVRYFNVDTEVVWVLFVMSLVFVISLMAVGVAGALIVRLVRGRQSGMLGKLDAKPDEASDPTTRENG